MAKPSFPFALLIPSTLGAVLLAVGIVDKFTAARLVPEALRFDGYELALIAVGAVVMIGADVGIVKALRKNRTG